MNPKMESHTALFLRTNLVANIFFFESCFKMTKEIGSKQSDAELFTAMGASSALFTSMVLSVLLSFLGRLEDRKSVV